MSPANFNYKARTSEQWAKREKGSLYEGYALDEFQTFSPKKENWVRILPPTWENPNHYGIDLWVHFGVGPNNGTVVCLYKMKNDHCPICEAYARAETQGNEKAAADYKPTRRVLVWLLDRNDEKQPLLWAMPWTVDTAISKICRDRQSGELYQIDHPDQGYDILFDKEGESITTKYQGFQVSRRPSSVDEKHLQYILEHPIPTVLNWRTYDEVKAMFEGLAPDTHQQTGTQPPALNQLGNVNIPPQTIQPPPPVVMATPPAPVQTAPPPPFVPQWTNTHCSICGEPQYTTPSGVVCKNGHGGVAAKEDQGNGTTTPQPVIAAQPQVGPKAANLRERFNKQFKTGTGQ